MTKKLLDSFDEFYILVGGIYVSICTHQRKTYVGYIRAYEKYSDETAYNSYQNFLPFGSRARLFNGTKLLKYNFITGETEEYRKFL